MEDTITEKDEKYIKALLSIISESINQYNKLFDKDKRHTLCLGIKLSKLKNKQFPGVGVQEYSTASLIFSSDYVFKNQYGPIGKITQE